MGISNQLRAISNAFQIVASFPELSKTPIIIGESDPEGCAACSARMHPQNAYRNGTTYSSYTAAQIARTYELADLHRVNLLGAVTWAFEFEDHHICGFRDSPPTESANRFSTSSHARTDGGLVSPRKHGRSHSNRSATPALGASLTSRLLQACKSERSRSSYGTTTTIFCPPPPPKWTSSWKVCRGIAPCCITIASMQITAIRMKRGREWARRRARRRSNMRSSSTRANCNS